MAYIITICFSYLAISLYFFGRMRTEYSHLNHTISELAQRGSITETRVSYLVFLPFGVCMAIVAYLVQANEPAMLFSTSLAIGYIFAAIFPIDPNAPPIGSWINTLHNLSGGISYLFAIAAFESVGRDNGLPYSAGKFLIFGFFVSLYVPFIRNYRGLLQRIVELAIFGGLLSNLH